MKDLRDPLKMAVVFDEVRARFPDASAHVIADMVDLIPVENYVSPESPVEKYGGTDDRFRVTVTREVIA